MAKFIIIECESDVSSREEKTILKNVFWQSPELVRRAWVSTTDHLPNSYQKIYDDLGDVTGD